MSMVLLLTDWTEGKWSLGHHLDLDNFLHEVIGMGTLLGITPPKFNMYSPWKMVVGRLLSYWEGNSSGANR